MRRTIFAFVAVAALVASPSDASSQLLVGPYIAFHDDADLGIGAFVNVPVPSIHENIAFTGDFGFFFPDDGGYDGVDVDYWELNANALYRFPMEDLSFTPWAMAGLNIANGSFGGFSNEDILLGRGSVNDTEIGVNLGGGVTFGTGAMRPFAGAKIELGGGEGAVVFGGLSFEVGGQG
jgi:hypothetical protein